MKKKSRNALINKAGRLYEMGEETTGLCTYCGEEQYGVEPDARGYTCDCKHGKNSVYGIGEILLDCFPDHK